MLKIFFESIILALVGTVILRLGGRKSISQMTIPQFAILLSIGTILGSNVSGKGLTESILAAATFVGFLTLSEWVTLKSNSAEKLMKGFSIPVISNGELLVNNLSKLRMSVDDLEKRLRIAGISKIEDIKTGTIEANGQFGYELMPYARPVTIGDLEKLLNGNYKSKEQDTIFNEVMEGTDHNVPKPLH